MDTERDRHEYAQWILERNLHWISAAEVKAGAIVAIDTAMLGALAAAFSARPPAEHSAWADLLSFISATGLLFALSCTAMSVLPRTDGPLNSFVFFGKIVKRTASDYLDAFRRADSSAFLEDCLDQVYRNAEIACTKFRWVRSAMMWSFAALIPWVAALGCLLKM
jgi:hypothetical protein